MLAHRSLVRAVCQASYQRERERRERRKRKSVVEEEREGGGGLATTSYTYEIIYYLERGVIWCGH